ncbi:DUF7344 domain-containing protein [Halosimplex amylolyticum]|uniref:DUF7344 domain-containing protein n=1 Tax=Halosimplex amylolyticum TaxID=3396616 RepID=UPI003F5506DD
MSHQSTKRKRSDADDSWVTTSDSGLTQTEIHGILSNERRVTVLELLNEQEAYPVSELAEEVAAAETDERPPPRDKRQSAYVTLDQSHLPKLDKYGVIDYDFERKIATRRPENFAPFREGTDGTADEGVEDASEGSTGAWLDWTVAAAAAGLTATVLSRIGLDALVPVSTQLVAEITLLALFVSLVYQKGRTNTRWFEVVRDRLR